MSEGAIPIKKAIPIIVVTWILSLVTTLAVFYIAPNIFPLTSEKIADSAIIATKLADESVNSTKILDGTITAADLAAGSVTTTKMAARAIPFVSTYRTTYTSITGIDWADIPGMDVVLTLDRTSHLLIMFSTEARVDDSSQRIEIRAMVSTYLAYPGSVYLTPMMLEYPIPEEHRHNLDYSAYSYNFCSPSVNAGTYIIKIQWRVEGGGTGRAGPRALTVIALPA